MAGLSQLLSFAPPAQTPQGPPVAPPPVDPVPAILAKVAAKKPLTADEQVIFGKLPANQANMTTESPRASAQQELGTSAKVGPALLKSAPPLSVFEASTAATPKNVLQDPGNPAMGIRTTVPQAPGGSVMPAPAGAVPQPLSAPAPPMPIAPMPIKPVNGTVPPTVISSAVVQQAGAKAGPQGAQVAARAMDTPVGREQVTVAQDAMDKFLKENPDGATLANILDAVGVAMSAFGGVQRQTGLQQRKAAQLQLAQAQALKQMDVENQKARAEEDYTRNIQLLQEQAKIAQARGDAEALQRATLALDNETLSHKNRLIEIAASGNEQRKTAGAGWNPGKQESVLNEIFK